MTTALSTREDLHLAGLPSPQPTVEITESASHLHRIKAPGGYLAVCLKVE